MADSVPVSGHIDPNSFPFILIDLFKQGATGSLKVEGAHHQKALYFRGGRILFGSSNDPKDQLGAILIESGRLTEEQFEDVNKKVGPGNPLARALADSGIVSQRELSEAARAKVERILSDVLSYESGSFEFEDGVLPKGAVDLKLSPERLFLAAVRRIGDRGFALRHLESLDVVLSPKPELQQKLPEIESELLGLASLFDGQRTLKEAAAQGPVDEFEGAKVACGLLFLGLVEKAPAAVLVGGEEASPFFVQPDEGAELDFSQPASPSFQLEEPAPTIPFGHAEEAAAPAQAAAPLGDETVMMGELPNFSLPDLSAAQDRSAPPPEISVSPVQPARVPGPTDTAPPLKIIAPPKTAERTRPPSKPRKEDLAALDELLGKKTPEGPLTPIQKPAEEWKPQFLPQQAGSRGGKTAKRGASTNRRVLVGLGLGVAGLAAAGAGWMYWSGQAAPTSVASHPATPKPAAPAGGTTAIASPAASVPAGAASAEPGASPAATPTGAAVANAAPSAATASPPKPESAPPTTPAPTKSPAPAAATPAPAKPTPAPKPAAATAQPVAGLPEARSLLRRGQFSEAARGFQDSFKAHQKGYSVQILVACAPETLQKAVSAVQAEELYVLPVHYKGRDCYRLGWGLYDNESTAGAGARSVPEYFRQGGARPKVVSVAELLK